MGGVQVGWGGGMIEIWGDECSVSGRDGERLLYKLSPTLKTILKTLTVGAVTTEAESLFQ